MKKISQLSHLKLFLEFVNTDNYIDMKLTELEELVNSSVESEDLMYHWENKSDEAIVITIEVNGKFYQWDFDIDELKLVKSVNQIDEYSQNVESVEEGLSIIESDLHTLLRISESKI